MGKHCRCALLGRFAVSNLPITASSTLDEGPLEPSRWPQGAQLPLVRSPCLGSASLGKSGRRCTFIRFWIGESGGRGKRRDGSGRGYYRGTFSKPPLVGGIVVFVRYFDHSYLMPPFYRDAPFFTAWVLADPCSSAVLSGREGWFFVSFGAPDVTRGRVGGLRIRRFFGLDFLEGSSHLQAV